MAHRCWECDRICYCRGDIDDMEFDDGPYDCECVARHYREDAYDDSEIGDE